MSFRPKIKPPMSKNTNDSKVSRRPWFLIGGGLLLVIAMVLAFRNSAEPQASQSAAPRIEQKAKAKAAAAPEVPSSSSDRVDRTARRKVNAEPSTGERSFPQVERILVDSSLTTDQAAEQLLGIVQRTELSEDERFEAMAHGLNLNFKAFAPAAADPELSAPLAQRYIDELANRNDERQEQIEGCLALMGNANEDIRTQAATQLAFYVEAEALAEQPDELRKAAAAGVEKLKLEKQKEESEK